MSEPRIWIKSSFSADTANCVEISWAASSKCSVGDCVQVRRGSDVVYVRDSKLGDDSPIQRWELGEWQDLLRLIKWEWTPDGVVRLADGRVEFGLERHDKLTFTGDEWKAFCEGVIAEEFEIDKLREFGSSSSGRRGVAEEDGEGSDSVAGPDQAATGAGGTSILPAPVAAEGGVIMSCGGPIIDDEGGCQLSLPSRWRSLNDVPAGRPGEDTPPVSPGLPAVTGQPGPGEPQDKSFVLFDYLVDKEIWFRDDDLAAEVRSRSGSDDDERWFQVGDQDGDALCWASVLRANPDAVAVMLTRSDAPLVPAVETQETVS